MMYTNIALSVSKLAIAGEQAGFSVEQMIWMLNAGLTVAMLIDLIEWRLRLQEAPGQPEASKQTPPLPAARWIM